MANIFDEIPANGNIVFSELNKSDLQYLLGLINTYQLLLREQLNISEEETFGVEIECENANRQMIMPEIEDEWSLVEEYSLYDGVELISPILRDKKENWQTLKKMCDMVSKYSEIRETCGGHIHVGIQALGGKDDAMFNFLKLWGIYEHIIFRFAYGEFLGPRPEFDEAAKSVCSEFVDIAAYAETESITESELLFLLSDSKCKAVNFKNYYTLRTIEFRCPNATFNPIVWQNNVNLFIKMLLYSKSEHFNIAMVQEKLDKFFLSHFSPEEIYTEQAVQFADLIFDNNLDKIYFLRQYLKSFEKGGQYTKARFFA